MGNDPVTIEKNSRSGYGMVLMAGVLWGFIGLFVTLLMDAGASAKVIPVLRTGLWYCRLLWPGVTTTAGKGTEAML